MKASDTRSPTLSDAQDLLDAGIAATGRGRLTEAVQLFEQALPATGYRGHSELSKTIRTDVGSAERRLTARTLLSLAFALHELGRSKEATRALADAEQISRINDSDLNVLIHGQHGAMLMREGRPDVALRHLNRAVGLIDHAPVADQCKIMNNRGHAQLLLGRIAAAREDFATGLRIAEAHQLREFAFGATHNLGFAEYLVGNLPAALARMPMVEDATSDFERGVVGKDRSRVLISAGLVSEADRTLGEACEALRRTELSDFLADAELARAEVALLSGDFEKARQLSQTAIAMFKRGVNRRETALAELVHLRADLAARQQGRGRLRPRADRLAATFSKLGLPDQARLARLIAIDCGSGDGPDRRPLPRLSAEQPLDLRLYGRLVRARLAFARGDRRTGRRQARSGLAELSEHQLQFGSLELQTSSAAHGVALAVLAIGEELARGRPLAVLTWLERARAISGRVLPVRPPADPVAAELLTQLRWVVNRLEDVDADPATVAEARDHRQRLEREIRARSWTNQGSGPVAAVPSAAELRAGLADDGVLLVLFILQRQVHGIVLSSIGCRHVQLGPASRAEQLSRRIAADLDLLAMDRIPAEIRAAASTSLRRSLTEFDRTFLEPMELPDEPLVVLPPGALAGLPWGDLPSCRGRPLIVAPSASSWLRARRGRSDPGPVVAIAGPGLRRAEGEVLNVAAQWTGCTTMIGDRATGESVLSAIDGAALVHVAAHGRHQSESPLFSSIRLADGPLVGYDLDRLAAAPRHVVLSACDLGQATVRPGDEVLGLTRALLHSGTSTVIAGVAKVSDHGAAELMMDYHRRLAAGSAPAYALADALAAADEPQPFVCFGAGW